MNTIEAEVAHKPSLGDPAIINELVRNFCKFALDTRADFHAGIGPRDPLPLIEAVSLPAKNGSLAECVKLTQGGRKDG